MQSILGTCITHVSAHNKRLAIINQLITIGYFHHIISDLLTVLYFYIYLPWKDMTTIFHSNCAHLKGQIGIFVLLRQTLPGPAILGQAAIQKFLSHLPMSSLMKISIFLF